MAGRHRQAYRRGPPRSPPHQPRLPRLRLLLRRRDEARPRAPSRRRRPGHPHHRSSRGLARHAHRRPDRAARKRTAGVQQRMGDNRQGVDQRRDRPPQRRRGDDGQRALALAAFWQIVRRGAQELRLGAILAVRAVVHRPFSAGFPPQQPFLGSSPDALAARDCRSGQHLPPLATIGRVDPGADHDEVADDTPAITPPTARCVRVRGRWSFRRCLGSHPEHDIERRDTEPEQHGGVRSTAACAQSIADTYAQARPCACPAALACRGGWSMLRWERL